ncbi:hypothetical protein [Arcobacter sp. FWKO B]|uniref:hypothetical protein n=1 Tax=Arcobacter sp. FWKO B TaxID=2593672 RepID=UPI0018A3FFA4|nr:hypothetical protein [Arcobacter sp. FWKO B]QOG11430.1 hypothetical protein FWKOB_01405 [Arcobacter sp. FWKO B]
MKNLLNNTQIEQSAEDFIKDFFNDLIPTEETPPTNTEQDHFYNETHTFQKIKSTSSNFKPAQYDKTHTLLKYFKNNGFTINTQQIERYGYRYTQAYFLTIVYENRHNKQEILKDIYRKLPPDTVIINILCGTKRKFKHKNEHKRKQHAHILIFTNTIIEDIEVPKRKLDIDFQEITNLRSLLYGYILDGHHIIKDYYIKIKKSIKKISSIIEQISNCFINKAITMILSIPSVSRPPS